MNTNIQTLEDELGKGRVLRITLEYSIDLDGMPCVDYKVEGVKNRKWFTIHEDMNFSTVDEAVKDIQANL